MKEYLRAVQQVINEKERRGKRNNIIARLIFHLRHTYKGLKMYHPSAFFVLFSLNHLIMSS